MNNKTSLRDKIRAATIGKKKTVGKRIVDIGGGQKIEVRQPTLGDRNDLRERCMIEVPVASGETVVKFDELAYQIWGVILFSYVPGSNDRVFDDTDYETLSHAVCGSYVDDLFEAFVAVSNVDVSDQKKT